MPVLLEQMERKSNLSRRFVIYVELSTAVRQATAQGTMGAYFVEKLFLDRELNC
jgi:hypothetical protein